MTCEVATGTIFEQRHIQQHTNYFIQDKVCSAAVETKNILLQ